jgi:hypothetical protein
MAKVKKTQIINKGKQSANFDKTSNNMYYYIGLAAVLLLIFLIRRNYLTISFERDEGAYAYLGNSILNGAVTFKDVLSQRLDGVFYAYAFLISIFGYSVKNLHAAFLVLNLGSAIMLFFLTRKLSNNIGGIAAAAFFSILSMTANASGFTIQSEHIVAFLSIAAFLLLLHYFETKKMIFLIAAGISFSLAFQVKQTSFFYGVLGGALLVYNGFLDSKKPFKTVIINGLIFSVSVVLPIAFDLFIIYKNGAWEDFNLWFFDIRKQYTSSISFNQGYEYLKMVFEVIYKDYKFFWIISFLGVFVVFFTKNVLWKKLMVGGLMISGFLTIVPGYHFYGHYFLQWIPAVSICAAIFIYSVDEILETKFKLKRMATFIALSLVVLPVYSNLSILSKYYFNPNHTQILKAVYGNNPFPESRVIADKLNTIMKGEDQLAMFGTEVQMYVYTNKKSPSRFVGSGALLEFDIPKAKEWQQEFISDIEKASPKYLVFFSHPISWMANPKVENLIFPWFDKFSAEKYNLIGYADMYDNATNYVWVPNIDLVNNPPKSQYRIFVFEKK